MSADGYQQLPEEEQTRVLVKPNYWRMVLDASIFLTVIFCFLVPVWMFMAGSENPRVKTAGKTMTYTVFVIGSSAFICLCGWLFKEIVWTHIKKTWWTRNDDTRACEVNWAAIAVDLILTFLILYLVIAVPAGVVLVSSNSGAAVSIIGWILLCPILLLVCGVVLYMLWVIACDVIPEIKKNWWVEVPSTEDV